MAWKRPYFIAWFVGGNYKWGWHPGFIAVARKYYRERWREAGYSFWTFVGSPLCQNVWKRVPQQPTGPCRSVAEPPTCQQEPGTSAYRVTLAEINLLLKL